MAKNDQKYTELVAEYEYVENEQGINCNRCFHNDPTGNGKDGNGNDALLPEVGDALGASTTQEQSCIVSEVVKKHFGDLPTIYKWTVKYTNHPTTASPFPMPTRDPKDLPISGSLSGELITVDGKKTSFQWNTDPKTPIEDPVPVKTLTMTVKLTKRLAGLPLDTLSAYVGHVNSNDVTFAKTAKFGKGKVLFEGITFDEYYNAKGLRRWKVEFSFSLKSVPCKAIGSSDMTYGGWQHLFNPTVGYFVDTTPPLYEEADIQAMFSLASMKENP